MQLFTNNASSTLAAGIGTTATSVPLAAGDGARFPNPLNGDFFLVTLFQRAGATEQNWEIVMCTARAGDVLTIARGQEGTTPFAYNTGDFAEVRLTAGAVLPARAGALTGALNEAPTVTLASSSAMGIGAAGANTISVTGTATINTFDAVGVGAFRRMTFPSAGLTITHNAVTTRCLSGASIVTEAGDWCEWLSLGGGNWQMIAYTRAKGTSLLPPAAATITGTLAVNQGGTGLSAVPAAGQIDIGNGVGFTRATLTPGNGITITNGAGGITISAVGGSYASTLKFS